MPSSRGGNNRGGGANRPLYAIDFTAVACGKRIANTKRRVRWRFGFANPDALAAGETGTACRGEEHDVTLVWSVTSGKRLILADGQEVHYSNSRSAVLDFSWTMRGNHVLKVVAHATAPMSAEPGFRQYDFFVDGRSFFSFPKVYRLGLTGSKTMSPDAGRRGVPVGNRSGLAESSERRKGAPPGNSIVQIEAPHNPDEEEAYLREAIKASLESEAHRQEGDKTPEKPKMSAEATDMLIDFMDDFDATGNTLPPVPTQSTSNEWAVAPVAAQPANQWAAPPPPPTQPDNSWAMASPQPPAPVQQQLAPAPMQQPAYDQYGSGNPFAPPAAATAAPVQNFAAPAPPASAAVDPFAAQAFAPAPPAPAAPAAAWGQPALAPAVAPVQSDPFSPQPPAPAAPGSPEKPAANGSAKPVLTMGSLTSDGLLAQPATSTNQAAGGGTMADKALQNLMGSIDSFGITGAAAKPPAAANNPFDSNNIMSNATLGEMKAKSFNEKKPVMNAPPGQGALVMANNQGGNWGGYAAQNTSQYGGMGVSMPGSGSGAPPQYSMSGGYPQQQPQTGYGQQQPQMGMQQPMMGQQPPMQQQYGQQTQYGQQPPLQQNQWGAPSY